MLATHRCKNEVLAMILSATCVVGMLACNGASAMGRAESQNSTQVGSPVIVGNENQAGSFAQGVQLGIRNGEIMAKRLRDRTVNKDGCSAMSTLEDALIKVTRTIRAPTGDDALVRGFFSGYTDALRNEIQESRKACGDSAFNDGGFVGSLFGTLICRAVTLNIEATMEMEMSPLFDGWSNGSDEVLSQCRTSATVVLNECDQEGFSVELKDLLSLLVLQSCSDTTLVMGEE